MIAVPLTQGYEAFIDPEDMERVAQYKWSLSYSGKASDQNQKLYARGLKAGRFYLLHRLILNAPRGIQVDHIDGDGLDCTHSNLRLCSRSQNEQNRGKNSNNKSGYKGVCWSKRKSKWVAQIDVRGKHFFLGHFQKPEDAAEAYRQAALKLHGEFAHS